MKYILYPPPSKAQGYEWLRYGYTHMCLFIPAACDSDSDSQTKENTRSFNAMATHFMIWLSIRMATYAYQSYNEVDKFQKKSVCFLYIFDWVDEMYFPCWYLCYWTYQMNEIAFSLDFKGINIPYEYIFLSVGI